MKRKKKTVCIKCVKRRRRRRRKRKIKSKSKHMGSKLRKRK